MAAYAAVVSLMHTIDNIEHHPSPPISIDKQQLQSLTEIINLFLEFLEGYNSPFAHSDEPDPLELRIAVAIHAAEDVIESCVVQNIQLAAARNEQIRSVFPLAEGGSRSRSRSSYTTIDHAMVEINEEHIKSKETSRLSFYEDVRKVTQETDLIAREVREIVGEKKAKIDGGSRSRSSSYSTIANAMMEIDEEHSKSKETSRLSFYEDVRKVIEEMDLIAREVREIVGDKKATVEAPRHRNVSRNAGFRPSISSEKKSLLVGADDELRQLMDMLTGGNPNRQIIPIVGMGGIVDNVHLAAIDYHIV